ncbi:Retrovirus-related Pol polyprotein from type-1 retrotransposable element R1 [Araneus ventricosus]|uniref:Retrovirus-related Pol polyprotein from type-1 retrotransposable element R1 n=1 Tax=Araneus ventricosus TaxID=182803 RepID=A0A4Y2IKK8_ARAVE|nr:Retrovirus-related Pol polyprotein from type-1 retrotransposable element R1 [Araneus ventricosus]
MYGKTALLDYFQAQLDHICVSHEGNPGKTTTSSLIATDTFLATTSARISLSPFRPPLFSQIGLPEGEKGAFQLPFKQVPIAARPPHSDLIQNSPLHAKLRQLIKIPPSTSNDSLFSATEIEAAFKNIRSKKTPGPDGLFGDIVKEAYHTNKTYMLDLFNACLEHGHFPSRWKNADLVMFNKANKKDTYPAVFHPICLLDALGNILDRLVTQRIFHHLLKNKKISDRQFGFTPGRSAPEAILHLKDWISIARSQGKHSVIISLDVKSAFSRVWWLLVLYNLQEMDCPRNLFQLVASFLDRRSISFKYGDSGTTKDYSVGCPQGSNSGPLYWLLVINDALEIDIGEDVKLLTYADDIYLFVEPQVNTRSRRM